MNARDFSNRVTNSRSDFLQEFLDILEENLLPFCVIGGLAVNAYAEPVVSLDLDLIVVSERLAETHPRLISVLPDSLRDRFIAEQEQH
jgi:hypothetical protein